MTTRRTSHEVLPPASEDDSNPHPLKPTPRNNTLRRCWGALKETVDALGAVWDTYDNNAEDSEVGSDVRSPSTPVSPKRPSLDIFKTPPSRTLHEPIKSHRSHYDTLANSPTTSKSSGRKRKTNPRRSTLTPTRRRNQKADIDHSYSTDEDGSEPHTRLLNRLFYQGPPQALDDKVCVFACPQPGLMENTKPNDNDGKEKVTLGQPSRSLNWQSPVLPEEVNRASMDRLWSEKSLSDRSPGEDSCLDNENPMPVNPHIARGTIERGLEHQDDENNCADVRDPLVQHAGDAPITAFSNTIAPPLRQLTERAASKIPTSGYNIEAWSRQVALQGDTPNTGVLDGTLPTSSPSGTRSLHADSHEDACVQREEVIDDWRNQVVPQKAIPNEALLDGKKLPMPHFETRKRRLQRRAASCVILSAAVPPERDTTDILTTPLGPWWGPTKDCEPSGMAASRSEETLMSTFGVACDLAMADNHPGSMISSANDVMSRSAAMGSMFKLDCTDAVSRRSVEAASRARLAFADDRNLWWHCVNNAREDPGSLCWTVILDMCELPPDFQEDDNTKAPVNRCRDLYRTIYDFYSMHHGDGSNMNVPQRFSIHNYYTRKLEEHTGSVWAMFISRWVPNVKTFPPANPVTVAAEAYTQVAIKDHPSSGSTFRRKELAVKALSKYVTCMPKHAWRQKEDRMRFVLDNGLMCFAQLVFVRCQALRFEIYLIKHPEILVPTLLP
jgi:hypothetical protein